MERWSWCHELLYRKPRFLSAQQLAEYRRDGFLVCRGLFGADEVARLRQATVEVQTWPERPGVWMVYGEKSLQDSERRLINRIENFYPYHAGFKALFDGDKLLGRVGDLFGEPAVLFKDKINFKLAGGDGFKPHQDQQAGWSVYAAALRHRARRIDDATEANGCLELAAGHHTRGLIGAEWAPLTDEDLRSVDFVPYPTGRATRSSSTPTSPIARARTSPTSRAACCTSPTTGSPTAITGPSTTRTSGRTIPPDVEREPGQQYVYRV